MNIHMMKVGVCLALLYVACLLWRVTMIDPAVINFHLLSLKTLFPGFQGYDALSMIWGAILAFGYGAFGSFVFHSLHSDCCNSKARGEKGEKTTLNASNTLWIVGALIIGIALGLLLGGRSASPLSNNYLIGPASMMRDGGSRMMEFGGMMMNSGRMMQERGGRYSDQEMMQQGEEMMRRGEQLRGRGSQMMEQGSGMMNMMR